MSDDEQIDVVPVNTKEISDTESEQFRKLFRKIDQARKLLGHSDSKDLSYEPSYTNFKVPYHMVCANRYRNSRKRYNRQFRNELEKIADQLCSAFEVARLMRHVSITTLWPPYHTRHEIKNTHRYFHLTQKEQNRLNFLMSANIV